tara:strand:- start:761 stop:1234 length:474 start_codon:yes stop_codon:yes gene_type:complete
MKFQKIKGIIGALAPTLATGLGSPIAGAAATVIAEALGCSPNPKSIEQALQTASPEQIVELKKMDKDFEVKMKELDVDLYAIQTKDIQDARSKFGNDWTPKFLAAITVLGFIGYIFYITVFPVSDAADDIVMLAVGSLTAASATVLAYYFGSSDKEK